MVPLSIPADLRHTTGRFPWKGLWPVAGLLACMLPSGTVLRSAEGEKELFNGKDLEGWVVEGPSEYKASDGTMRPLWQVRDGHIVCAGKGFGFLRYDKRPFANFHLRLEYRLAARGNSGIGIRTCPFDPKRSMATRPSFAAYEIQLLDDAGQPPSKGSSGSLYRYIAPKANPVKPAGEWNAVEVECVGPRIRVRMNGEWIQDVDQSGIRELKDKPLKGFVSLQSHSLQVEFRNIRLREIQDGPRGPGGDREEKP